MAATVEFEDCKLLRSTANYLHQSLRNDNETSTDFPSWELAWTDGERVWLSPLQLNSHGRDISIITAQDANLIGEFEGFVYGVLCSSFSRGADGYFIAVILKEKVVVLFRKIGDGFVKLVKEYSTECIPQGYAWHPSRSQVAILSKSSAVLLSISEELSCTVIPIKTFHVNLQACAWSSDGQHLAIAVNDGLCVLSWKDWNKPSEFIFHQWNHLKTTGRVKCIVQWQTCSFLVATELPLELLLGNDKMNNCDLFEAENSSTFDQNDESFYEDGEAKKSALNMNSYSAIITKKTNQDVSSLLKFKLRKEDSGDSSTAAQIIAISFDDSKLNEVCRARVKGLVSPDLLLFQPESDVVVVGSHCSSKLHCFGLLPDNLNSKAEFKAKEILELNPDTKPKGLCLIPGNTDSLLVLLGKTKRLSSIAFPPSGFTEHYDVSLQCLRMEFGNGKIEKLEEKFHQPEDKEHCINQGEGFNGSGDKGVELLNCDTLSSLRLPDGSVTRGLSTVLTRDEIPKLISELKPSNSLEFNGESEETFSEHFNNNNCLGDSNEIKAVMSSSLSKLKEKLLSLEKRMSAIGSNQALYPFPESAGTVCESLSQ
ncbi:WD repeat and coiled-coil-containing protein-like isoform X2 [Acropora palmata]|uniref:WD repeat and coiled-coil-containing protein-like isoform X2 n=1 Tax=Acropora palmata TaxID=6131 RepID=UPI003DA0820D